MLIKVLAFPGAARDQVVALGADRFEVYVRAEATRGQATRAVARALAAHFHLPLFQVRLVKGSRERHKIFEIR